MLTDLRDKMNLFSFHNIGQDSMHRRNHLSKSQGFTDADGFGLRTVKWKDEKVNEL